MTMMKSGLRLSVSSAILSAALAATTTAALAQAVVVQGNRRVDTETIRSYVTPQPGQPVNVEQARRELINSGLFSDVRVTRRGSQIVVAVRENDSISRVVFQGNSRLKTEVLEGEVQSRSRGPFSQALVNADVERLREVYRRSGRSAASVNAEIVNLPNGRVDVVFRIVEGAKTGVREINFSGNSAYSASRLRGQISTTESNWLSWLKSTDVYDADRLAADLDLVRRFYLKNGYADFRVVSSDARYDEARQGYIINVVVEEGPQYRVGDVQVESRLRDVDSGRLQRLVRTSSGSVYNAEDVEKSIQRIGTEVGSRGYAFGQVRPVGQRDASNQTISLTYVVDEGPRVFIERVNIKGNSRTRDNVIRRELDVGEGDAYNRVLIDRAERRLNNTGYFKKVRITNEPGSSPDRVVVNIEVEDQPTGAFSIAGGYSTSDGFIGEISLSESNFLGRGQFVRIAGSTGSTSQGIDFSFTEPYFLDRRMSAGFDLFSKFTDNAKIARYENRVTGGQLRLGLPFTEELTLTLRYAAFASEIKIPNSTSRPYNDCSVNLGEGISQQTIFNADGSVNRIDNYCIGNGEASVAIKEARGTTFTSAPGYTLTYNTLDSIQTPRNGLYAEFKQDVAGLGGDSRYVRTTGEARFYQEVYEDIVGFFRVQAGHVVGFGGKDLRIVDNFFQGPSLVRGFAPSGIGPRDLNGDFRNNPLGGTTYYGASVELQFPLYGIPRELGMRGAIFADAGSAFGYNGKKFFDLNGNGVADNCNVGIGAVLLVQPECVNLRDSSKIRSSVGASLLWNSPLGPIRFDYAYALSKDQFDRTQVFRFSGGTRF